MGVEFNENKPLTYNYYNQPQKKGGLTNFVIKLGFAKDEAGANKVMIATIVICLVLAIVIPMINRDKQTTNSNTVRTPRSVQNQ